MLLWGTVCSSRCSTSERPNQDKGLDEGALGISFGINYVPATTRGEILDVFAIAAERRVPCYVHLRYAGAVEPGSAIEALQEVIAGQ